MVSLAEVKERRKTVAAPVVVAEDAAERNLVAVGDLRRVTPRRRIQLAVLACRLPKSIAELNYHRSATSAHCFGES